MIAMGATRTTEAAFIFSYTLLQVVFPRVAKSILIYPLFNGVFLPGGWGGVVPVVVSLAPSPYFMNNQQE